jgi:hypothetical protein
MARIYRSDGSLSPRPVGMAPTTPRARASRDPQRSRKRRTTAGMCHWKCWVTWVPVFFRPQMLHCFAYGFLSHLILAHRVMARRERFAHARRTIAQADVAMAWQKIRA